MPTAAEVAAYVSVPTVTTAVGILLTKWASRRKDNTDVTTAHVGNLSTIISELRADVAYLREQIKEDRMAHQEEVDELTRQLENIKGQARGLRQELESERQASRERTAQLKAEIARLKAELES